MRLRIFLTILLLLSAGYAVFSQEKLSDTTLPGETKIETGLFGVSLSKEAESALSKNGFSPVQETLSDTGQDEFAYNLILNFPENQNQNENKNEAAKKTERLDSGSEGQEAERASRRDEVIFCFTQEDFSKNRDPILDFLVFLKDLPRDWSASVLFSALDESEYRSFSSISGTRVFAESVDDADSVCAVSVSFECETGNALYTGSLHHTTPLWLTQRISDAFFDSSVSFSFQDVLSAVYRLGIIRGRERLSFFFMNDIPAVEVNFSAPSSLVALKKFSENYTPLGTEEWDMHYIYLNRGGFFRAVFINERTIIIACLSVGILTIFILCAFSFVGRHGERHKYEFIKSVYLIPITIGISFLSLVLGQRASLFLSSVASPNPVILYGIKIVFSMIFISILFAVQEIFKFSVAAFIYGYLLSVVAIFNIFLFATQDLTLFVIFAFEYVIIYVSRSAKKLPVLIIFFILMTLPFAPYGYIIIKSAGETDLMRAVFATHGGNLLLSFGMFPFQIMWLKILMFMNIYAGGKGYSMKRIIFNDTLSTLGILLFVSLLIFSVSHFVYQSELRKAQKVETKIVREEKFTLSAKLSSDSFSGMDTKHVKIKSEIPALRYEVVLHGIETAHPIYDSIYDYRITPDENGNDLYEFVIPDYPPEEITIDYACDMSAKALIGITAFYKTGEAHTFRAEKRELKVE